MTASVLRRRVRIVGGAAVSIALPQAVFYGLRATGTATYPALLWGTAVSAAGAAVTLARERRLDGLSAFVTTMMLGSVVVAVVAGDAQALLAREALLTAVAGLWFAGSTVVGRRPLAYLMCRPLLDGRMRWPAGWEDLWERSPQWRRMWRVSSILWGIGTLADAVVRVVMAYRLPSDVVPLLGTLLYAGTLVVLNVVTTVYYVHCGVYDRRSPLYATTGPTTVF